MNRRGFAITLIVLALGMSGVPRAQKPPAAPAGPVVVLETQKGAIEIELFQADAPKSVAHLLALVRNGFYRGLRFHWSLPGVIQVGDPTSRDMSRMDSWGNAGSGRSVGVAEISKRKFEKGIVGLAYREGQKPTAADSQIFILRAPNPKLDGKYCAIGRVIAGMNVVEKIEKPDMLKNAYVKGETPR
jgi:cyclophilin family peptidyl-prolyl cis-trans isomerase